MSDSELLSPRALLGTIAEKPAEFALDLGTGISWWMRGLSRRRLPNCPDGPNVILLRGVWEPPNFLLPLAGDLVEAGFCVHSVPGMGFNLSDVKDLAERVEAYVCREDLHDVVIVGHSKGGLVGKQLLLGPEAKRFRGLVAISTPFHGSSWARYMPSPVRVSTLAPEYDDVLELAAETEVNHLITSISTDNDLIIPEGSELDGARNVRLDMVGHYLPLSDAGGLDVVRDEIRRRFEQPPAVTVTAPKLHRRRAQWRIQMDTDLSREELRHRLFDARRHERAVPLTQIVGAENHRIDEVGLTFTAVTAGRLRDRMRVVHADADSVVIRKLGPLMTGEIRVDFDDDKPGSFTWEQKLQIRTMPTAFTPALKSVGKLAYETALKRIVDDDTVDPEDSPDD